MNWDHWKGPAIFSRDSLVSAVFFMGHWRKATETIWRDETDGIVTTAPATQFQPLANVDGAVIFVA